MVDLDLLAGGQDSRSGSNWRHADLDYRSDGTDCEETGGRIPIGHAAITLLFADDLMQDSFFGPSKQPSSDLSKDFRRSEPRIHP